MPEAVRHWRGLVELSLEGSQVEGRIPEAVLSLQRLDLVLLKDNLFAGSIPEGLLQERAVQVSQLDLRGNRLAGAMH